MMYEKQRIWKSETKATINENPTNPINSLSSYWVTFRKNKMHLVKPTTQTKKKSFLSIRFGIRVSLFSLSHPISVTRIVSRQFQYRKLFRKDEDMDTRKWPVVQQVRGKNVQHHLWRFASCDGRFVKKHVTQMPVCVNTVCIQR